MTKTNSKATITIPTITTARQLTGIYRYGQKKAKELKLKQVDMVKVIAGYRTQK